MKQAISYKEKTAFDMRQNNTHNQAGHLIKKQKSRE